MRHVYLIVIHSICTAFLGTTFAQKPGDIQDKHFDITVRKLLKFTVPTIDVKTLHDSDFSGILLDARENEEFMVSHIPNAIQIGFDDWDQTVLDDIAKDTPIIIYCSIGYRSEKIGEKLIEQGFTNVKNLYGSIFEWANRGYTLVDSKGKPTQNIHGYNRLWGYWIQNKAYKKVFKKQ